MTAHISFQIKQQCVCVHVLNHFSCVQLFATLWTQYGLAHQAPLSLGFSWQECWSGLTCLPSWGRKELDMIEQHQQVGNTINSDQFSSVAQSCLWDPMNRSTPGLPVHHQLPEFTQTHVH